MSTRADRRLLTLQDLINMPAPQWLVEGLFESNALVMLAGAPGSYKSFLALDWMLCMVLGRNWHDRRVKPSKVLYILGEGKSSVKKRMQAWCIHNEQSGNEAFTRIQENFRVTFDVPQFATPGQLTDLLGAFRREAFVPEVIVIDTFARSFVGSDENSSQDTGRWIEAAEELRKQGYSVLFVHHTRKNTEFGHQFRGSTAILGAMDTAMTVVKDTDDPDCVEIAITKQKDHDEGEPLRLMRLFVPNGEQGSIVLIPAPQEQESVNTAALREVSNDASLKSLGDKGKALAVKLNIKETTAKSRVVRFLNEQKQISKLAVVEPLNAEASTG